MTLVQTPALLEAERREKETRVRQYLAERGLGALVLSRVENFAWLTAGANNRIVTTEEAGAATLVYTADGHKYVITNVSEARRMQEEEFAGLGWEVRSTRWDQPQAYLVHQALNGRRAAADTAGWPGIGPATGFNRLRYQLTEAEVERLRWLCARAGAAVADACRLHQPGETEYQAAARLHAALAPEGITPAVVLVASDDRIFRYRHPVPTAKPVERYMMVVIVAEKWGLHAAATRFVHFGPLPGDLAAKYEAVAAVDSAYIGATQPGTAVRDIFMAGRQAYTRTGFGDEWLYHHQGGAIGYASREYLATAETEELVLPNQAFAWNPSIAGAKAEDTILATMDGPQILTAAADWPLVGGRPGPLIR